LARAEANRPPLQCPSARPDDPSARVFAVVDRSGAEPRLGYLAEPTILDAVVASAIGDVAPGQVLRMTSRCVESGCKHFAGSRCSLGERLVRLGPVPAERQVPPCAILGACRWFREQGVEVCYRCRWVVSEEAEIFPSSDLRRQVASPVVDESAVAVRSPRVE
jgi:hypothetical protein